MNRINMLRPSAALIVAASLMACGDGKGAGKADTGVAADTAADSAAAS